MTEYVIYDETGEEHDRFTDETEAYRQRGIHEELYDGAFYVKEEATGGEP